MFQWFYNTCCVRTDLWFQSASSPCLNRMRTTWAGATKWPKTSFQTARTLVRDAQQSSRSLWKRLLSLCSWTLLFVRCCWCCILPGFSTLRRKQRADCRPRVFLRGLHAPAAGPQPAESQRLHPSGPKGLFPLFYPSVIASIWFPLPVPIVAGCAKT